MCGRFALFSDMISIVNYCDFLSGEINWEPHYNIPPGIDVPLVVNSEGSQALSLVRWGFIPHFSRNTDVIPFKVINARSETINRKKVFKHSFKNNRCLVPANGFYEWRNKDKQPFFFTVKNQPLFFFAGIWSRGTDRENPLHEATFAIITTDANDLMKNIHNRMPVIFDKEIACNYLVETKEDKLQHMLSPYKSEAMDMMPVSKEVNSARHNHPELIEPVEDDDLFS